MATGHWLNKIGLAPLIALMFGIGAATLVAAMLPGTFAAFAQATGLAGLVGASRPLAMLAAFVAVAVPVWLATSVVERALDGRSAPPSPKRDDEPLDLEPFADGPAVPARRPIFADRELGAPLMSDEALRSVAPTPPAASATPATRAADDEVAEVAEVATHAPPFVITVSPPAAAVAGPVEVFEVEAPEVAQAAVDVAAGDATARPSAGYDTLAPDVDEAFEKHDVGETLAQPLVAQEFDLAASDEPDEPLPGESSIDALIRRLESGLARRGPPPPETASPHLAEVLRSEVARAAPVATARTGKPDDATAKALHILRQMANS